MKIKKVLKIVLTIVILAGLIGLIIYLFPLIKDLFTESGRADLKNKLDELGAGKICILSALQLLQILLVVIPGEPLEILAGVCFGTFWGTIFIMVTVFITTTLIFILVRKFGKSYVEHFFKKEKIEKIENSKFFKDSKNVELVMIVLFLIPGTPKDLLVYIGGLLPIKARRFIFISTFARFPSVISSTLVGSNLMKGNLWFSIMVYAVTFILAAAIVFIVNKIDKTKMTKEALDAIK